MSTPPDLVIFDCDGVLVDSEHLAAPVLATAMRALGLPTTDEDVDRNFRGMSLPDCLVVIEEQLGRPVPSGFLPDLELATRRAFEDQLKPIAGIRPVLERLRRERLAFCVASSGSHAKIRHSLRITGLLELLEPHLFSASDVRRGKPAPDLFLHAMAQMGSIPARSVVVEDSAPGVRAGLESGARVLSYTPLGAESQSSAPGATAFRSMEQLPSLLGLPARPAT